jgi:hypothetical protein
MKYLKKSKSDKCGGDPRDHCLPSLSHLDVLRGGGGRIKEIDALASHALPKPEPSGKKGATKAKTK